MSVIFVTKFDDRCRFGDLRVIRKSLRKSPLIFGDPRVSLYVSSQTADHYFWCSRVFLAVLRVFQGIMGCSRVLRGAPGVVPGVFRGVPGVFRGVPGFTDTQSIKLSWKTNSFL